MKDIRLDGISTRADKEADKIRTKEETKEIKFKIDELQNILYAESKNSLLVVIQGMDGSGKDGVIRNVFGALNPQGVLVKSFKAPSPEELAHDFLWRIHQHTPAKGMIQIFNRSHYEDVLVTRVHGSCDEKTAKYRMKAINDWEELLKKDNNTTILKFYLHVSAKEQLGRLEERVKDETKMWKYNAGDFAEARLRDKYIKVYEDCFANCNDIPWTIVPSDQNWFKENRIAKIVLQTLENMNLKYPGLKEINLINT